MIVCNRCGNLGYLILTLNDKAVGRSRCICVHGVLLPQSELRKRDNRKSNVKYIDIVFENPPGPKSDFVEVSLSDGASTSVGTWLEDKTNGYHVLRITEADFRRVFALMPD